MLVIFIREILSDFRRINGRDVYRNGARLFPFCIIRFVPFHSFFLTRLLGKITRICLLDAKFLEPWKMMGETFQGWKLKWYTISNTRILQQDVQSVWLKSVKILSTEIGYDLQVEKLS